MELGAGGPRVTSTLAALGVSALDVVYGSSRSGPAGSPLAARILVAAAQPGSGTPALVGEAPPPGQVSVAELLTLASALRELMGGARPREPSDCTAPGTLPDVTVDAAIADELAARLPLSRVQAVRDQLQAATDLRTALLGAGLDTFAQRRPEIAARMRIFEVDRPGPQEWKRQRLIDLGFGGHPRTRTPTSRQAAAGAAAPQQWR